MLGGAVEVNGPGIGVRTAFSLGRWGDLPTGNGRIANTAYGDNSLDVQIKMRLGDKDQLRLGFQRGLQNDVSLQSVENALFDGRIDHRDRSLLLGKWIHLTDRKWISSFVVTGAVQNWNEESSLTWKESMLERQSEEGVRTMTSQIEVRSNPIPFWNFVSGLTYENNAFESKAIYADPVNGNFEDRGTWAENADAGQLSLFSMHTIDILKLKLSFGARAQAYQQSFEERRQNSVVFRGNISGLYPLNPHYHLYFTSGGGYRQPNIYDYSSLTPLPWGFGVPSDTLSPERSFTSEVGLKARTSVFNGSVSLYRTQVSDLIDWRNGRFMSQTSYLGLPVFEKTNVGQTYVQGIEAEMEVLLTQFVSLYGGLAYAYGRNQTKNEPLSYIPPLNSRLGLSYKNRRGLWSRIEWRHAATQNRLGWVDVADIRIPDQGTPGWNVVDIHLGWDFRWGYATLGLQNVLNEAYFLHGSGVPGLGRVALLSLKLGF